MRAPEEHRGNGRKELAVLPVVQLDEPVNAADGDRGWDAARIELETKRGKTWCPEIFALEAFEDVREDVKVASRRVRRMERPLHTSPLRNREGSLEQKYRQSGTHSFR